MNRPGYEYTVPVSTTYYPTNSRPPQYDRGYGQLAPVPVYSPTSHPLSNYADIYEGNNDTTLRAEERHWYIENHKSIQPNLANNETISQEVKIKKDEEKKTDAQIVRSETSQARQGRKENRCSCECWPSAENNEVQNAGNSTTRSMSGVDMVASYGVYGSSQDDESSGFEKNGAYGQTSSTAVQGVIVNQQGNSAVVRTAGSSESTCGKCCWSQNAQAANSEDYCWLHYCRPALIVLLMLFFLVLLGVSTGFLLTNNYLHYQPRPPAPEEACEKTFCRWGAECVSLGDGRAHCACPTSCPSSAAPVCSTAGRTYRNHCFLRKEACERRLNLRVKHEGECEAGEPCSAISCPTGARCVATYGQAECRCPRSCQRRKVVCGTDGREYPSACHLDKHACENQLNITVKYHGKCDPCLEHECGDGSVCQLNEVRAPVCRCGTPCDLVVQPGSAVCGSDYKDYISECTLRLESCRTRQQLSIAYRGECASAQHPCESVKCGIRELCTLDAHGVAVCGCGPECEDIMRPVCGSDGRTYDNPCLLHRAACFENRDIRVAYMGACGVENPCALASCPWGGACIARGGSAQCSCPVCDSNLAPVCGSDHNTYGSECKMRMHACQAGLGEHELKVRYNGTCLTCADIVCQGGGDCDVDSESGRPTCRCNHNCTELQAPDLVCGSDGQTYPSQCELDLTACRDQSQLRLAYNGDCALCEEVQCAYGAHCVAGECLCPTDCTGAPHEPVCGSTMQTYPNECELQKAACGVPPPTKLHVIFYGDCKDRLAVVPPIAMTTTAMTTTEAEQESTDSLGATDGDTTSPSACRDIRCDFDASCEIGFDGYPRCSCLFECPTEDEYFPVCASDFRLYPSLCAMRKEGCQKQLELRLRPLDLCKGMEVRPCGNSKAMIDLSTGLEIDCGNGPHRQDCPLGSYCHITLTAARCCPKNDLKQDEDKKVVHCSESLFGCCADGSTFATGPNEEGCPITSSSCGCNRLGSVSEHCDDSGQCVCRPGVGGLKCDRCEPGYWGLPRIGSGHSGCIPCGCSAFGSVREDCEQMTGRCVCRTGVQGQKCTVCADHRRRLGPNGCSDPENLAVAESCAELSCYFGAVCTERTGGALCECAAAPCLDSDLNMLVCGSDGKTYESECHLKLQACRTQDDIVVQAFGPCKLSEIPATAGPPRPSSPIQFTQQDDGAASKSTRHLLNPDKYYNKYEWTRKETPSDFDTILSGQKTKGSQTATTATVGAVGALLGDLCTEDSDCAALPGAICARGGCVCRPGYIPTTHRKACAEQLSPETTEEYSACLSDPCYNLGTCIDLPGTTYACVCADHFTGTNCETVLKDDSPFTYIETPSFDGSSYIRLKPLKAYHKLNIDIEFKAFSENGVILYNQQKPDGTGDFVSLALVNGYLEFRYNLGNGAIVLTSLEKLTLNEYHKVSAKRYHRDGILSVDNMEDVAGQSRGNLKALDLADDAYIGYVHTNYSRVFDNIGTRDGFIGCVKYLRIIRHQVTKKLGRPDSLVVSIENVQECQSNPCMSMPCKNGATCRALEGSVTDYACSCPIGFQGSNCDERLDPCESNPCGYDEGLLCDIGPDGGHVCRCLFGGEIGSNGNTCNNDVNVIQETWSPQFNGTSYVELMPLEGLGKAFRIEIWFLTNRFSGMLLYTGQSNKAKGDFIAINLVNGYLQFRYNLGSGIANITSPVAISKGRWHRVRVGRAGRHGSLQLDHHPVQRGHSPPPLTHLELTLPLFIGSLPSYIRPHKMSGVTSSFIGAMQQVFVNGNPLSLYSSDTAKCVVVPEEERLPCATSGVTKYSGPPCGNGLTPCKNNGSCIPLLNEYKCVCRDGYEGRNCEVQLKVEMLNDGAPIRFDGNNYYSYRSRGGRRNRGPRGIRYEIKFRTFNESGLIMWRRKIGIRPRDFIGLGLSKGKLQLIYTDTDMTEINSATHEDWFQSVESKFRVDDGMWHTATLRRRKRLAMLQVDDLPPVRGYSQSLLIPSRANPKLWIGGSPSIPLGLPPSLYTGLRGCIASVKANGRHLDITSPIRPMTTIRYCG